MLWSNPPASLACVPQEPRKSPLSPPSYPEAYYEHRSRAGPSQIHRSRSSEAPGLVHNSSSQRPSKSGLPLASWALTTLASQHSSSRSGGPSLETHTRSFLRLEPSFLRSPRPSFPCRSELRSRPCLGRVPPPPQLLLIYRPSSARVNYFLIPLSLP